MTKGELTYHRAMDALRRPDEGSSLGATTTAETVQTKEEKMARYPGNDTTREIIAFALPARDVCEKEFFTLSHLCRTALFNDLKARGYFNDSDFNGASTAA